MSDDSARGRPLGELHALHVHPRAQGNGLGGRLLAEASAVLADLGFERVRLWALEECASPTLLSTAAVGAGGGLRRTVFLDGAAVAELAFENASAAE